MDFTREPIIESILSPKDGYKLSIRHSSIESSEEFIVNSLQIVSFGTALFFRSIEKPKAFLLPVTEYEVVQVKEARMVLKNVSVEKNIRIGEGNNKEAKSNQENTKEKTEPENKKSGKKRNSRKRRSSGKSESTEKDTPKSESSSAEKTAAGAELEGGDIKDEVETSSSVLPRAFPTPPKIIGRKLPTPENERVSTPDVLPSELEEKRDEYIHDSDNENVEFDEETPAEDFENAPFISDSDQKE